jgi:CheY-like chemotaxis protein
MDKALLPRAFEVFVQGTVINRSKGGLGIGLSVVHTLAARHGASLAADSPGPGQGSTFTIRFPLAAALPAPNGKRPEAPRGKAASVLVIEDNGDVREMMCAMLAKAGYAVIGADTGHAGLARASEYVPDVALVDIDLPDISGHEVARQLRAAPHTAGIRLIAVTGYGQQADRLRALENGFDVHLKKPVKIEDVIASIDRQQSGAAA